MVNGIMKSRPLVALFTASLLLVQGVAWASTAATMLPAAVEQAAPCHDDATNQPMSCCEDDCSCGTLCSGQAAVAIPAFFIAAPMPVMFRPRAVSDLPLSVNHHERLRPPITL